MMSTDILAKPRAPASWRELKVAIVPIAIGLIALGIVFHAEVVAAIDVWIESTAYNHCFLVIPIVAYLIWDRRAMLAGAVPQAWPAAAILALPFGAVWFLADRVGIMEGRQLAAMCLVELLLLAVLGWRLYHALLGPLLYLFFLVPFGAFITPQLQDITAAFTSHGLDLLGIPNYSDGYTIEIPEGSFVIAQACAGLRFLIAAIAFGCLYALLMYRSSLRRGLFILVSIIVPVIANGFRALGIVVLGHILGSAEAAATDHVLYGWIFFSIVILLLVILGLPFREDGRPQLPLEPDRTIPPASASAGFRSVAIVIAVAVIAPLIAAWFDHASAAALPARYPSVLAGGCRETTPAERSVSDAPGRVLILHLSCDDHGVEVRTELFSPRTDPGTLAAERHRLLNLPWESSETARFVVHGVTWRMIASTEPVRIAANALWIDGSQATLGLRLRLVQGWRSIVGGGAAPVLMVVAPEPDLPAVDERGSREAQQAIREYLQRQPGLEAAIARMSEVAVASAQETGTE
jgi:exosortase A